MILHPGVIALLLSSALTSALVLYSSCHALLILRHWDLASGSRLQLELERRTYLISTILSWVFAFELVSLFLLVYTADRLSTLFTGAMCAAGTLQAGEYGYAALLLKLFNFLLAGLWLMVNHVDQLGFDYPLVRRKYAFLLAIVPLIFLETVLQARFFLGLRPEVITSCCGRLFSAAGGGVASELAALPIGPTRIAFYLTLGAVVGFGLQFLRSGGGSVALSVAAGFGVPVALASIVSFISPYLYELPTHHCPFCLLQAEYGYLGYPLYLLLLGGALCGLSVGIFQPLRRRESLAKVVPPLQRKLALGSVVFYGILGAIVTYRIAVSHLRM